MAGRSSQAPGAVTNMAHGKSAWYRIILEQARPLTPEQCLCVALLGSGVAEATWPVDRLAHGDSGTVSPTAQQRHEAWAWLCDDSPHPWSAAWVCDHLDVSLRAVRRAVHTARDEGRQLNAAHCMAGARNQQLRLSATRLPGRPREEAVWASI